MDIGEIFLGILETVSNVITKFLSILPNPDPFPGILDNIEQQNLLGDNSMFAIAYYWLDSFFIADAIITMISLWFLMFPIAWIIMMLWKWLKAR